MVTFYQVGDSGETKKVDFSDLSNFALKDECHLDGLSKDTLDFDELLDKGIYTYSDFDDTEKEDGNWPSALTSGYVVVMVEDDSRAQRGITQMVLDDNNGSYYRRGILSETENVFKNWNSLNADNNSMTNLSLGKSSPSAIDGVWTEVSNLSYDIKLWKQINDISTMSTISDTNVILNGIETLALTGAQTIYVRDSTGAFSKLCLDISCGGTGATNAAGARGNLGLGEAATRDVWDYDSGTDMRGQVAGFTTDGTLEIGPMLDFHQVGSSSDFDFRISVGSSGAPDFSKPLPVASGGTGATSVTEAQSNLGMHNVTSGFLQAGRGGISDLSWNTVYNLNPGTYLIANNASNSPETGSYGNMLVSYSAGNRVVAVAAFDNGHIYINAGAGRMYWKRVDETDAIVIKSVSRVSDAPTTTTGYNLGKLTAPNVSGYTFLLWVAVETIGAICSTYATPAYAQTTTIWTTTVLNDRGKKFTIIGYALYCRS